MTRDKTKILGALEDLKKTLTGEPIQESEGDPCETARKLTENAGAVHAADQLQAHRDALAAHHKALDAHPPESFSNLTCKNCGVNHLSAARGHLESSLSKSEVNPQAAIDELMAALEPINKE